MAGLMAIIGIFLILSFIFNSYSKPFLVLLSVPFGIVGIFIAFYLHNLPLSLFAAIGLVGLSGIVINGSIILIDHITYQMKSIGIFSKDVLIVASVERLRPIALTTISTICGVAPTAYAIGGYDSLLSPLSMAIMYGLLFGSIVVLIFIPCIFNIGEDIRKILYEKN